MWGTFLSNYKYFSCQSICLLLVLEVCKNRYRKENTSVGGSKQWKDEFFRIHLRETWLVLFRLLWMSLSFSIFIFSAGIKLFIRHPAVPSGMLILSEPFNGFVQLPSWCILKDRQLCLHKYVKYWVLYPIITYIKQIKTQDMTLTRIRMIL